MTCAAIVAVRAGAAKNPHHHDDRHAPRAVPAAKAPPEKPPHVPSKNPFVRGFGLVIDILNKTGVQFFLYLAFVFVFQLIAESLRLPEEYFFDKFIADTLIDNHFDSSHNTFLSIRRAADVWEWGNNVLWPGLFGNLGPCNDLIGRRGGFQSSLTYAAPIDLAGLMAAKGCNADAWPDGDGSFHMDQAVGWTMPEIVEKMDTLDWTEAATVRGPLLSPAGAARPSRIASPNHLRRSPSG